MDNLIRLDLDDYNIITNNLKNERFYDNEILKIYGQLLKNYSKDIDDPLKQFIKICQKNTNIDIELYTAYFKSIKKPKKSTTEEYGNLILKILNALKEDMNNTIDYDNIIKKFNIKSIINDCHILQDNQLHIVNVFSNENTHHIELGSNYCHIINNNHYEPNNYIVVCSSGDLFLKCHSSSCRHLQFPVKSLIVPTPNLQYIFNTTINNYNTYTEEQIPNDILKLIPNKNIYENDKLNELLLNSLSNDDTDIGEVIFYLCNDKFKCVSDKNWYEFDGNRWLISEGINFFVTKEITNYYFTIIKFIENDKDINDKNKQIIIKEIKKIIKKFKCDDGKKKVIKETGLLSRDKNKKFEGLLDSKPYLIGFDNGIYDLKISTFRQGLPEDMITMSVGYDYNKKYSENKNELLQFLDDILPIEEDREYFLKYLSTGLIGLNECELFTILTGVGRNGKSKLVDLIKMTFGNYFANPKCKLLTNQRPDENSPEPGLLSLKKKRIIICSEPEKGNKLNSGFIKFITGNDSTELRECHKNDIVNFKPNFITFLVCNDIPDADDLGNALIKRLRCVNFPTEFVDNPRLSNHKLINKCIQEKINNWKEDFMLLLLEYYIKYRIDNLTPTQNVLKWTKLYREDNDKFLTFLNDCTETSETHIHVTTLFNLYKGWFRENYPGKTCDDKKIFIDNIKKHKEYNKSVREPEKENPSTGFKNIKILQDYLYLMKSKFL